MEENNRPKKMKNKADKIIEIVLLNIIPTPVINYGKTPIKSLGIPNKLFLKNYINLKIIIFNYISFKKNLMVY